MLQHVWCAAAVWPPETPQWPESFTLSSSYWKPSWPASCCRRVLIISWNVYDWRMHSHTCTLTPYTENDYIDLFELKDRTTLHLESLRRIPDASFKVFCLVIINNILYSIFILSAISALFCSKSTTLIPSLKNMHAARDITQGFHASQYIMAFSWGLWFIVQFC